MASALNKLRSFPDGRINGIKGKSRELFVCNRIIECRSLGFLDFCCALDEIGRVHGRLDDATTLAHDSHNGLPHIKER